MLRTVPVECFQVEPKYTFELRLVPRYADECRQLRIVGNAKGLDMGVDFEARPMRIIHQEQAGPVVGRQVAGADVLAVSLVVGEGEGVLIDHLEEATRAAPMLHIRPAGFGYRRHIEAVACGDESRLVVSETLELTMALKALPDVIHTHPRLHGLDAGRYRYVEKSI